MQGEPIEIVSFNVNGVLNPIKRSKILTKLKREKAQIAFLQETHLSQSEHAKLKRQGFKSVFSSSYKTGSRRGVAILISNSLNYEHISELQDEEGRFVKITGKIEGCEITLINVYIPPGSDWLLYRRIFDLMVNSTGIVICGGDFNIKLNPRLDISNSINQENALIKRVNILMKEFGIIDVWRELYPNSRDYTHYSHAHSVYSRIDYFFVFNNDRFRVNDCKIKTIDLSDHSPLSLSIALGKKVRNVLWKFNSHILNDSKIRQQLKEDIKTYLELNSTDETSQIMLWDALKAVMRGRIISMTSHLKKLKMQKLVDLQSRLKQLQQIDTNESNPKIKEEIKKIKNDIDDIYTLDTQKKIVFLKQKYYEVGSKSTKLLAYKLRKQRVENTIHKIKHPHTKKVENKLERIQESFELFYKELYSEPQMSTESQIDDFLKTLNLPTLTNSQNEKLVQPITTKELNLAISKLKVGKSPGPDGYTTEWYKSLKEDLCPVLLNTFNWIIQNGEIPPSWRDAVISVIPKEGKDKQNCSSYRPISVLNLDYKLFTAIIARRLEQFLPQLINLDQCGFIQQRQALDNIRRSLHIIEKVNKQKTKALIVGLDAEKAFDSVRWSFLYKVLAKFGFNKNFITLIQSLYDRPRARVKINGDLSDSFHLERGTRQGCPISPLLFVIFFEPLGQLIRQTKEIKGIEVGGTEQKVAMFADDVLVFLEDPEETFMKLLSLLNDFGKLSGYKLNLSKTQVMALNYSASRSLKDKYNLDWDAVSLKYLGIILTKEITKLFQANYDSLSEAIKSDIHRWNLIPYLNLNSRMIAVKMNILPRLLYLFRTLPVEVPESQFKEWDKWVSRFIWQGKKPRIRYTVLQLKKEKGGAMLSSFKYYYYASQVIPLLQWCNPDFQGKWKTIEFNLSSKIPLQAAIADKGLAEQLEGINPWLEHTLKIWHKVIKICEIENMLKNFRWCAFDTDFQPNKSDKRFLTWIEKGLTTYLSFTHKGILHSFQFLQTEFGLEQTDFFRFLQLRDYFNKQCKSPQLSSTETDLFHIVKSAFNSSLKKGISKLYNGMLNAQKETTIHVKNKWEHEAGIKISNENWERVCLFQWTSTNSLTWREHCWKNVLRFFKTPNQSKYKDVNAECWRKCGSLYANHFHIFWECPKLHQYWSGIHKVLSDVFEVQITNDFINLYLGLVSTLDRRGDIKLLQALLAASKKSITRKWLNSTPPTLDDWFGTIKDIYKMEKLTYCLRTEKDKFDHIWNKWINFISPIRNDFA